MRQGLAEPKYHLAFDMDDTLASYMSPVMEKARQLYPSRNFKLPAYDRYNNWFEDNFPAEEANNFFMPHVYHEEFYSNLPPAFCRHSNVTVKRVSEIAWSLYKTVSVVTARKGALGDRAEEITRNWLRAHNFHRVDDVEIHAIYPHDKKSRYLKPDTVMVDDNVRVAIDLHTSDHKMILVSQPWNDIYPKSLGCRVVQSRRLPEALEMSSV